MISLRSAEICKIKIPVREPFKVSFGTITEKISIIVKLVSADGIVGYGECPSFHMPLYLPDFTDGEYIVLRDYILPIVGKQADLTPEKAHGLMEAIKGHQFAKSAVESALWCIRSSLENRSLKQLFGGVRDAIEVGESLGIAPTIEETLNNVEAALAKGYRRIKLKIQKGWDHEMVRTVRNRYPDIPLMVDGNSDYRVDDIPALRELDQYNLLMIEQPLRYDDLVDHAKLQKEVTTPVCLDESIESFEDARRGYDIGAYRIINIKPARVGGPIESMRIHDFCADHGLAVWCGGLFETGIGRAINIALASKPNFTLPADMSEPQLLLAEDLVEDSYTIEGGLVPVRDVSGLGYSVNEDAIQRYTVERYTLSFSP